MLDGASSVYGSDAIAGVVNLIIDDKYEGLAIDGVGNFTQDGGAFNGRIGFKLGARADKGGFTFAAEYFNSNPLQVQDREYFRNSSNGRFCSRDIEIDQNTGARRETCAGALGALALPAILTPPGLPDFGGGFLPLVQFVPGATDGPIPNFSFVTFPELASDPSIRDGVNGEPAAEIQGAFTRTSLFSTGDYKINNYVEAFFEASYSNIRTTNIAASQQIFPTIPGDNPFNPFGVDTVAIQFIDGIGRTETEREQTRIFAGIRGEFGFAPVEWLKSWSYDVSAGYTRSLAVQRDDILLEERLALTLLTSVRDPDTGEITCGGNLQGFNDFFGFLDDVACVPVNFFAPELFQRGALPQDAFDFLTGQITTDSSVDQAIVTGFISGKFPIKLPGGRVGAAFGVEWREDGVDTDGDTVFNLGLAAGRNLDRDSRGRTGQKEFFGELSIPVFKGQPFAESLDINVSGRVLDNRFFGFAGVYSTQLGYRPNKWILLRGTAGTSFRSPDTNLLFLGGQSGFAPGSTDPCDTPPLLPDGTDPRNATVLANCRALGINPANFSSPAIQTFSTGSVTAGGEVIINPERSFSWTAGFSLENPWTNIVGARFSATYWSIEVRDGVTFPGAATVTNNCFNEPNFQSVFCSLITRDPVTRFIRTIETTPLNLDQETVAGVDFSLSLNRPFKLFGEEFEVSMIGSATRVVRNNFLAGDGAGGTIDNPENGEFGDPKWRATANVGLRWKDVGFNWNTTFASGEVANVSPNFVPPPLEADGGRDIFTTRNRHLHNLSLSYAYETWRFNFGVANVFNRAPELVDSGFELFSNTLPGQPVTDFLGRRFTVGFQKNF